MQVEGADAEPAISRESELNSDASRQAGWPSPLRQIGQWGEYGRLVRIGTYAKELQRFIGRSDGAISRFYQLQDFLINSQGLALQP